MAVNKKKNKEVSEIKEPINFLEDDDYELNLHGKDEKNIKETGEKKETTKDGLTTDLDDLVGKVKKKDNIDNEELHEIENNESNNFIESDNIDSKTIESINEYDNLERTHGEVNSNLEDSKKGNKIKFDFKELKVANIMIIASAIFGIIYYIVFIINILNDVNYFQSIVNATLMLVIFELLIAIYFTKRKLKEIISISASIGVIIFLLFNILIKANIFNPPTLALLKDYTSASLIELIDDCKDNNIKLNKLYEFSDNVPEGEIISQNIAPKTVLKEVKELTVVISNGPNYDKTIMLTDFVGLKTDNVLEFIENNKMSNTTLNFDVNNEVEKDVIVSQSIKGEIRRNTEVTFNISLGSLEGLQSIKIDDLKGKKLFDAVLYLKRNGIKYELKYEFSTKVPKNHVISQNIKAKTEVKPMTEIVILTISQGAEIKVPDFSGKTSDDVINWIVANNLKVAFEERYDVNVPKNGLIGINYEAGVSISEGTRIIIITSLGPIIVPSFNSLAEFRNWAQTNNIKYEENYEYSSSVSKGNIINLSVNTGDKIDPTKTSITVNVSQGAAVVVPYFVGKSKSEIQNQCRNAGLNCTFYYTGYSNTTKDYATKQNVASGVKVVSGTYINIGLSSGPAQTFSVFIQGEWFQTTADNTIAVLRSKLASQAPGVTFNFVKKSANTGFSGQIHDQSPIKGGANSFTQGKTYTIWVIA